jgi:hypothetical protein
MGRHLLYVFKPKRTPRLDVGCIGTSVEVQVLNT